MNILVSELEKHRRSYRWLLLTGEQLGARLLQKVLKPNSSNSFAVIGVLMVRVTYISAPLPYDLPLSAKTRQAAQSLISSKKPDAIRLFYNLYFTLKVFMCLHGTRYSSINDAIKSN